MHQLQILRLPTSLINSSLINKYNVIGGLQNASIASRPYQKNYETGRGGEDDIR